MSTSSQPSGEKPSPTFFVDRDLGRVAFPEGLRAAGLSVVTIFEYYGTRESEGVDDDVWLPEAARNGWPVFTCDSHHRRRRRPAERQALLAWGVQEFLLGGQAPAPENVTRVLDNLPAILEACARPGPFVMRLHPDRIEQMSLD